MRVPFGHVLINSKWQNSDLVSAVQGKSVMQAKFYLTGFRDVEKKLYFFSFIEGNI